MQYVEVYLKNVTEIYTWHTSIPVQIGSRVELLFRNKPKIGVVTKIHTTPPDFETKSILSVLDLEFVPSKYIDFAFDISEICFCKPTKVLSLMIPSKFFLKKQALEMNRYYTLIEKNREVLEKIKGKKQKELIEYLGNNPQVEHSVITKLFTTGTIKSLLDRDIIRCEKNGYILASNCEELDEAVALSSVQLKAVKSIKNAETPSLLWGVTGSGKTEIYKQLAKELITQDGQMLLLVPEIGLTPQLINHFKGIFGDKVVVWHSNLSDGEKLRTWLSMFTGEAKVLIGARSAVLVPIPNLKLIILDEEHEWTYKNEFVPRFWTHDIVELLAQKFEAQLLFGTATPRVESINRVEKDDWNLVRLDKRFFEAPKSNIQLVDLKNEIKRGNASPLSEALVKNIREIVNDNRQVVLFLNKRGFAGATMCRFCGQTFECKNCSAHMKVHGISQPKLICHICHYIQPFPKKCPTCSSENFKFQGWGTQQVEQLLKQNFPDKKILRADSDALGSKYDFDDLIQKFHNHEADILLGTQMIAKGLDFAKVDLVGLILADVGLNLPDFRSEERVFQLLNQVAGRTGRRGQESRVIVQTFEPDHEVFKYLLKDDIPGFLETQKLSRKSMNMPPFSHIAKITFSDPSKTTAFAETKKFFEILKQIITDEEECFWAPAFFPKVHNKYWFYIFLKTRDIDKTKAILQNVDIPKEAKLDLSPISLL